MPNWWIISWKKMRMLWHRKKMMIIIAEMLWKCTIKAPKEKLKAMDFHTAGMKENLVTHFLGLECPPPKESWETYKDGSFLARLLQDSSEDGAHHIRPEYLHELHPFNRWPFDCYTPNFFYLYDATLLTELITQKMLVILNLTLLHTDKSCSHGKYTLLGYGYSKEQWSSLNTCTQTIQKEFNGGTLLLHVIIWRRTWRQLRHPTA